MPPDGVEPGSPPWREALRPLRLPALLLAAAAAVLFAARVALLLLHRDAFGPLGAGEVARAFLRGALFDLSAACTIAGLPLLVLSAPLPWSRRPVLRAVAAWAAFAGFALLALAAAADLVYFGYVGRHVGPELRIAHEDLGALLETAFSEHAGALVGVAVLGVAAAIAWRRRLRAEGSADVPATRRSWGLLVLVAALLLCGARGSLGGRSLVVEDAYEDSSYAAANLSLDGPFCALQAFLRGDGPVENVLPKDEALALARRLLVSPEEKVADPAFPLCRARPRAPGPHPNVVVVMLEGWSATTVDELRAGRGLPPLGITPRFSALAREGLLLRRMHAAGQRTRVGLTALLAGVGALPGVPTLGEGLEDRPLRFLGDMAKEEGYRTLFFMGFLARAQREAAIATEVGFDEVVSGESILGDGARGVHAAPDHRIFEEASRRLRATPEPFLAFVHTASTHVPYAVPPGEPSPFPADGAEHRFHNAVAYADRALGEFVDRAKADGWFGRTVFLVVSDHVQRVEGGEGEGPDLFRIPGLLVGPGIPRGVHDGVAGHEDAIPTVAHAAGWGAPYAALGRSILDADAPDRGAQGHTPTLAVRVEGGGWVARGPAGRSAASGPDPDGVERRLLAITEAARALLLRDHLAPRR